MDQANGCRTCGFALIGRKPLLTEALIAFSISWKLYSGLLLLWLAAYGPRRALYSAAVTLFLLCLALPTACFGIEGVVQMYTGWREQIRIVGDPWVYLKSDSGGPPLVTSGAPS